MKTKKIKALIIPSLALCLYAAQSASAALVFQMDFNDADGNQSLTDRGTTGATGTESGNFAYSTTVAPSNYGGYSGSFDGSSGAVDFGDIDALDGLSTMTITAWIRMDSAGEGGAGRIVRKRDGTTSGFETYYHATDSELEFVAKNSVANGGGSISFGDWTFIAMTYDSVAEEATFYTGDGTTLSGPDTVTLASGSLGSNSVSLLIGNIEADSRTFDGLIDNVRIYDSVENSASLESIMQFNDASFVPEPSSTALLGLGGLAFALRRRRA